MYKIPMIIYIIVSMCSCVSIIPERLIGNPNQGQVQTQDQVNIPSVSPLDHWITLPRQNELVFIGVSGRQSRPEAEIDIAREHAAMMVSMYHSLHVDFESIQNIGAGFFDYFTASTINVDYDRQIDRFLDRLSFDPERDVFTRNNATFIRFNYTENFPGNINFRSNRNNAGRPDWVVSPPQIDGFITGVGFVRRQERIRDGLIRSAEAAAASIVSSISATINAGETVTDFSGTTFVRNRSTGRLTNFLVIETWIDPETEGVWTLAIARPGN